MRAPVGVHRPRLRLRAAVISCAMASVAVAIVTTPPPVTPTATYVNETSRTPTLVPVPPSTGVELGSSASPATVVP